MKSKIVVLIYLLSICFYANSQIGEKKNHDKFIYAAYCAGYTILNESYVDKLDFSLFNYYYLMALPVFNPKDFDMTGDSITKKYVQNFDYLSERKGIRFAENFIDSVHGTGGKVLLSMNAKNFVDLVKTNTRCDNLVVMLVAFIKKYNYDGFDLDWEQALNIEKHYLFLKKMKEALDRYSDKKYFITTALPSSISYSQPLADSLSRIVDWINLMTYDLGGGNWKVTPSFNTPMTKIEQNLEKWNVFFPHKLCIGLASYGYKYTNLQLGERIKSISEIRKHSSYITYPAIIDSLKIGWREEWNNKEHIPYYLSSDGKSFITADNPRSIEYKLQWAIDRGYRGFFWWELYHDFKLATPSDRYGKLLLKDSIYDYLKKIAH